MAIQSPTPAIWLRRYLIRIEEDRKVKILVRPGKGSKRTAYRVSLSTLRRFCPELFDWRDEAQDKMGKLYAEQKRQVARLTEAVEEQNERVAELVAAYRSVLARQPQRPR